MRRRGVLVALALLAGLVLAAAAVGRPDGGRGGPLDPAGTGPLGAKALVLVLEELGADVDVVAGRPPSTATTAVVLRDRLTGGDVDATLDWVAGGGVLLVADATSPLALVGDDASCPAALSAVTRLLPSPGADTIDRRAGGDASCFGGFVRSAPHGEGFVVAVASANPFVNGLLDEADNALLAAAVLAPSPGGRVAFVDGPSRTVAGDGDDTLTGLVPTSVRQSLLQAGLAVLVWALWRARRLGRPVVEHQPVAVAGSELVVAVGRLLDARRNPGEAAAVLRSDARRALGARLGLGVDPDVRHLAAAVAARGSLDADRAAAALGERPVGTDAELAAVVDDLDRIRSDVLGSPAS